MFYMEEVLMIALLLYAPFDGHAYVREGEQHYAVQPPYVAATRMTITPLSIASATKYGSDLVVPKEENANHETWEQLYAFLTGEIVRSRQDAGVPIPSDEELQIRIIETLSEDEVAVWLGKIEFELIPQGNMAHARRILTALRAHKALTPKQRKCVARLLAQDATIG